MTQATARRYRRRRRRGRRVGIWALRLAIALALLAIGVALGRSLEENADQGVTVTKERPLTFTVGGR